MHKYAVIAVMAGVPAFAEVNHYEATLSSTHESSSAWSSAVTAVGTAKVSVDHANGVINSFELRLTGLNIEDLAPAGPNGSFGSIHFHNYPQGGPNFFVQQLPLTAQENDGTLIFSLSGWKVEDPVKGIGDASFVLNEILSGNAYIGVHTNGMNCKSPATGESISCAAPATAISGHVVLTE